MSDLSEVLDVPVFVLPVRVYYEDTDHGGVVYYANYLKFMERCRTEYLRHQGLEQDVLIDKYDLIFVVRRAEIDYIRPATFNDRLLVTAQIIKKSRVKLVFKQQIYKCEINDSNAELPSMNAYFDSLADKKIEKTGDKILLCESEVTIVSLSAGKMQPKRVSENILEELMRER